MEAQAPPVVAVMVAHDPGPWFEEALGALVAQDYPNLSILVVDAASTDEVAPRVAAVAPHAFVRRLDANCGFGPSCNEALQLAEGITHFLFCHDDVAADPDALRNMVLEAYRSNAGVVAPKLVDWRQPDKLLSVGLGVDSLGRAVDRVEEDELDQRQHDAVREVFLAPGAFTLVRADLFVALSGFDPSLKVLGEDLDLSWRVQLAGGRVVVAPTARVRHLEALRRGDRGLPAEVLAPGRRPRRRGIELLERRHRTQVVLSCYGRVRLVVAALRLATGSLALMASSCWRRDFSGAVQEASIWGWCATRDARSKRTALQSSRRVPDRELCRSMSKAPSRLVSMSAGLLRRAAQSTEDFLSQGPNLTATSVFRRSSAGTGTAVAVALSLLVLFGSRGLLGGHLPVLAALGRLPSWEALWKEYLSGWSPRGFTSGTAPPLGAPILGTAGLLLGGSMGFLRRVLLLCGLPIGMVGAWRLGSRLGGPDGRWPALLAWTAVPLPYEALARGDWQTVLAGAAVPFLLYRLVCGSGMLDDPTVTGLGSSLGELARSAVATGLLLALVAGLVPGEAAVFTGAVISLCLLLALRRRDVAARLALLGGGCLAVATLADLPYAVGTISKGGAGAFFGLYASGSGASSGAALLRFSVGHGGGLAPSALSFGLLVAAVASVVISKGRRRELGVVFLGSALLCVAFAWLALRFGFSAGSPGVLLVPAAGALAGCAALGGAAIRYDLPAYHFGWRQLSSLAALGALLICSVPVLGAAGGGRWGLPDNGLEESLQWLSSSASPSGQRVLWVGEASLLPVAGTRLTGGLFYGAASGSLPELSSDWYEPSSSSSRRARNVLLAAYSGSTVELGRLLAPFAVRYIVVPLSAAAATPPRREVASGSAPLLSSLSSQLDLRRIWGDPSVAVFENLDWYPEVSLVRGRSAVASKLNWPLGAQSVSVSAVTSLRQKGLESFAGRIGSGELLAAFPPHSGWHLVAKGSGSARRDSAFGVESGFTVARAGAYRLFHRASAGYLSLVALQALVWLVALTLLLASRPRARSSTHSGVVVDMPSFDAAADAPAGARV